MAKQAGKKVTTRARRGGRPSQEDAAAIRDQILDIATQSFLTQGYGTTSIEAIALQAHMSKRTFYHRFHNKEDLFAAVAHRLIERMRPDNATQLFKGKTLEEILLQLAKAILNAALSPQALALHRVITAEATRFRELAVVMDEQGARKEAIERIAALLEHEQRAGHIQLADTRFAAEQFLQLVISAPQHRALGLGTAMSASELTRWIKNTVDLFLHGCRVQ